MSEQGPARQDRTAAQAMRFLLVGGTNTIATYGIFILLGLVIEPWIAYTIAFAIGLLWVSLGSSRVVFRARLSARRVLLFVVCYLAIYGVGQLVIRLLQPEGFLSLVLTSIAVLAVSTPLTFIAGKFIFRRPDVGGAEWEREQS